MRSPLLLLLLAACGDDVFEQPVRQCPPDVARCAPEYFTDSVIIDDATPGAFQEMAVGGSRTLLAFPGPDREIDDLPFDRPFTVEILRDDGVGFTAKVSPPVIELHAGDTEVFAAIRLFDESGALLMETGLASHRIFDVIALPAYDPTIGRTSPTERPRYLIWKGSLSRPLLIMPFDKEGLSLVDEDMVLQGGRQMSWNVIEPALAPSGAVEISFRASGGTSTGTIKIGVTDTIDDLVALGPNGQLYCFQALRGGLPVAGVPITIAGGRASSFPTCTIVEGRRGRFEQVTVSAAGLTRTFSLEQQPGPD